MVRAVVPVPRIFDNLDEHLAPALQEALENARSADFCVGYFKQNGRRGYEDRVWAQKIIEIASLSKLARVHSFARFRSKLEALPVARR